MKNKVKMIIDRKNLTARFECEGDIWKWMKQAKIRNWNRANEVLQLVEDKEVKSFFYEMHLDKLAKRFQDKLEIIEL